MKKYFEGYKILFVHSKLLTNFLIKTIYSYTSCSVISIIKACNFEILCFIEKCLLLVTRHKIHIYRGLFFLSLERIQQYKRSLLDHQVTNGFIFYLLVKIRKYYKVLHLKPNKMAVSTKFNDTAISLTHTGALAEYWWRHKLLPCL